MSLPDVPDFRFEVPYLTLVRVWIAQERIEEATGLLERLLQAAEAEGRGGRVIEILMLRALAFQAQASSRGPVSSETRRSTQEDNITQAMTSLEHALSLAEPEGYVRVFVDEGSAMNKLLRQAMPRGIAPEYVPQLLLAFDGSEHKMYALTQPLTDPLSERELEVLRLLMTHLSSTEIAQELFIAVSTARSHIKSIYGKLGVHSRAQAVARAQDIGLL